MNVIIGLQFEGTQFLIGVHFNLAHNGTEVSDIREIFPKDNAEWLNWINQGKLLHVDGKEEIQTIIDKLRMNPVAFDYVDLDSVANIITNFDNLDIPDIKKTTRNGAMQTGRG